MANKLTQPEKDTENNGYTVQDIDDSQSSSQMTPWQSDVPMTWWAHAAPSIRECTTVSPRADKHVSVGLPFPPCDIAMKMHDTDIFAQDKEGNFLSCFLWVSGQPHEKFKSHGIFEIASLSATNNPMHKSLTLSPQFTNKTKYDSFISIGFNDPEKFVPQTFLFYSDVRQVEMIRDTLNDVGNRAQHKYLNMRTEAKCITLPQMCCALGLDATNFADTFVHGYDGQLLIQARPLSRDAFQNPNWYAMQHAILVYFLRKFGDMKIMLKVDHQLDPSTTVWHVEFFEHGKADDVIELIERRGAPYEFKVSILFHST